MCLCVCPESHSIYLCVGVSIGLCVWVRTHAHTHTHTHTHGVSLVVQLVKNPPAMQETQFDFWVGKIPWRKDKQLTPVFLGFPGGLVKNPPAVWETWVLSLGGEDLLEEGMAANSNILAWKNPQGQRSPVACSPWGRKESDTIERLSATQHTDTVPPLCPLCHGCSKWSPDL